MVAPQKSELTDHDLATCPTVYAAEALKNQVALVSGGAGGIGRAIAWLFARLGAHVVLTGRDQAKLDLLVTHLVGHGFKASALAVDIREPEAIASLFDKVWEEHGRLDILVNSAGGQSPQAAIDFSIKGWNAVINTNLGSLFNMTRPGVIGLSRAIAVEWAPLDIRVNCVAPGLIETSGWEVYSPEARAAYSRGNPMMHVGSSWDIAEACAYLSAASGKYITGETLTVDGGGQHWGETWTTGKPDYFRDDEG